MQVLVMRDQDDAMLRFQDNVAHQERFNSAVKHLRRVFGALQEANVAEDHPDLLSHRQYLAELLAHGNEPNMLRKAEELLQLIIPSLCDRFGVAHLCTQRAMSTLVFLLEDEGKDEEAEPWKLHLQTYAATAQPLGELDLDIPEERTHIQMLRGLLGLSTKCVSRWSCRMRRALHLSGQTKCLRH